jgi:hypothetical protein
MTQYTLQTLLDREAIRDCLFLYCRGIDRLEEKALRAAYWPDATDNHGAYKGTASGFIDMALVKLQQAGRMVHQISNILIELHGDVAAVESYFTAYQEEIDAKGQPQETMLCGRYVDRFEKRHGEWRVAARTVVYDWQRKTQLPGPLTSESFELRQPTGGRFPRDAVYELFASLQIKKESA